MDIIVSHDVDHISWREHFLDTFIPGLIYRSFVELASGAIDVKSFFKRLDIRRPLNNLDSLDCYLTNYNIPSTFFFGMRKGLNLSYNFQSAVGIIKKLQAKGYSIALHGMNHQILNLMEEEKLRLETICDNSIIGIRNHYLRQSQYTYDNLYRLGYSYISNEMGVKSPHRVIENLWSFPISIMDVDMLREVKCHSFGDFKQYTMAKIEQAQTGQLPYFVINFHDVYYCDGYPHLRSWFDWIIQHFYSQGYRFVSFEQAIKNMNAK